VGRGSLGRLLESVLWEEIKDEIEPEVYVTLQFLVELIFEAMRDEIKIQPIVNKEEIVNYGSVKGEDEIGEMKRSP
jgi:ribosome biogenesis GTPase A